MYKERLQNLRKSKNISQDTLTKNLNIARGSYSHYETEHEIIPIKHLNNACNFFNTSLDYIFEFTNNINYENNNINIDKKESGIRLKKLRKENHLTQKNLAIYLNTSQSAIAEYERGTNTIPTPFLYTICKKYNISADYLLGKIDYIPKW